VTENSIIPTTDYANGFIYENSALQFFNTTEGYVEPNGTDFDYIYLFKDHLDNIRLSYIDVNQNNASAVSITLKEEHNFYPFGLKHKGYNTSINGTHHKYMFGSKEYDESFQSLNTYDFGARNYDAALGRWMNIDPLAEQMRRHSPYSYAFDNPIFFIDPDGRAAVMAPIYDTDGDFLGTDDQGLQGKAIVMDSENFTQGMSHDEALTKSEGAEGLSSQEAGSKLLNHYNGLKSRPDYDGFVTIAEGIDWAKSHPNADFRDPSNALYLDASKLNFGNLSVDNLVPNLYIKVNLLNSVDMSEWSSIHTTYALGNTSIKLVNSQSKQVKLRGDIYDWDYHNYNPKSGKIPSSKRDKLILLERMRTGLNDNHGVPIRIYGTGKLN